MSIPNPKHLYFISDEEIKDGDWCFTGNKIQQVKDITNKHGYIIFNDETLLESDCKKIIASTDTSLNLPQPSKEWVEYFVSEWNKGNKIEKVKVEYDVIRKGVSSGQDCIFGYICSDTITEEFLKVNSDNTINIKQAKDSWSREEVLEFTDKLRIFIHENTDASIHEVNMWIKNNL